MSDDDETITITKVSGYTPVSGELLRRSTEFQQILEIAMGVRPDPRTPEQIARDRAEWEAETARLRAEVETAHALLLAASDGLRRAVLELHAPTFFPRDREGHCDGCDGDGYEYEEAVFPCRSYELARDFVAGDTE